MFEKQMERLEEMADAFAKGCHGRSVGNPGAFLRWAREELLDMLAIVDIASDGLEENEAEMDDMSYVEYRRNCIRLGLFYALVEGPRKSAHSLAASSVKEALKWFDEAQIHIPNSIRAERPGLQWAEAVRDWTKRNVEGLVEDYPQTRANAMAMMAEKSFLPFSSATICWHPG